MPCCCEGQRWHLATAWCNQHVPWVQISVDQRGRPRSAIQVLRRYNTTCRPAFGSYSRAQYPPSAPFLPPYCRLVSSPQQGSCSRAQMCTEGHDSGVLAACRVGNKFDWSLAVHPYGIPTNSDWGLVQPYQAFTFAGVLPSCLLYAVPASLRLLITLILQPGP